MRTIISFLILLFCLQLNAQSSRNKNNLITVIGITGNTKQGACILSENNVLYYIDGLTYWGDQYTNKKVIVKGKLKVRKFEVREPKDDKIVDALAPGKYVYNYIMNSKWELYKEDTNITPAD